MSFPVWVIITVISDVFFFHKLKLFDKALVTAIAPAACGWLVWGAGSDKGPKPKLALGYQQANENL